MVTVECPLCGKAVEIPEYDLITRSDALMGHIVAGHIGKVMPPMPDEGPPLPKFLRVRWSWKK